MAVIEFGLTLLALLVWIGLLTMRGQFWRTGKQLELADTQLSNLPSVCAIVPARNEANLLPITLRSLLSQDYPGDLNVILVDDCSTDGTSEVAKETAINLEKQQYLHILNSQALPSGWSGKLWALDRGIKKGSIFKPDYFWLADADIEHDVSNLSRLVIRALQDDLDLTSVMVKLRCKSFWEKLLIPAFVFFFQKLYPFQWVNNPDKKTAAAAGGCILIRRETLEQIGGIAAIRQALIDDCALADAVKSGNKGRIWLGLSTLTRSLRPYPSLATIWDMVARTAFTQLNYSPLLLVGTTIAMALVYIVPPVSFLLGVLTLNYPVAAIGLLGWLLMSLAYLPTVLFYQSSPFFALCLPAIAFLYTLMTVDSALRHWRGLGGAWKGRIYQQS